MLFTEICRGIVFSVLANSVQLSIFYDWQLNLLFLPLMSEIFSEKGRTQAWSSVRFPVSSWRNKTTFCCLSGKFEMNRLVHRYFLGISDFQCWQHLGLTAEFFRVSSEQHVQTTGNLSHVITAISFPGSLSILNGFLIQENISCLDRKKALCKVLLIFITDKIKLFNVWFIASCSVCFLHNFN